MSEQGGGRQGVAQADPGRALVGCVSARGGDYEQGAVCRVDKCFSLFIFSFLLTSLRATIINNIKENNGPAIDDNKEIIIIIIVVVMIVMMVMLVKIILHSS